VVSNQCPNCGKEIHDEAAVYCPFCGTQLIAHTQTALQTDSVSAALRTIGYSCIVAAIIPFIATIFAVSYYTNEVSILGYPIGRVYPYEGYAFPLGILGVGPLFASIILMGQRAR
jgi:hypothetical protein